MLRDHPALNELIVLRRRRGLARVGGDFRLAQRLRRSGYDVAIDLHGGPRSAWLAWLSRAPMRIGYRIPGRTWMYTHVVERSPEPSVRHSVLNQWDLLAPLGIDGPPVPANTPVEMPCDPGVSAGMARRLAALGVADRHEVIAVHVSASNPFKRWPAASFVELVVHLVRDHPARFAIVLSGPSEPAAAERVAEDARRQLGSDGQRVAAPQVDLRELRAVVERASVYIGGDSGPLHVAATTRTPIVEILGPTVASRSFPWRSPSCALEIVEAGPLPCRPCDERTCAPGDFRCLTRIPAAHVIAAAERALSPARTLTSI
ncbi:MAG TPA: glycosyltransferase family 9 protein [Vicinamibacterales bacterium]|nr:glycosyltransferase family 9 protein [Vicinamibacterales bacterium]